MKRQTVRNRPAFTLVEVLIVIAIIGILMGLALAGINAASKAIKSQAIAIEMTSLAQSVESYKTKHGSYPPDGSSRAAFQSHFRSVFPNMLDSEFTDLYSVANSNAPVVSGTPTGAMDPAEALVFCLGGFSKSPTKPFTGPGGPLAAVSGGGFQYNVDRNEPLFPFDQGNLSLDTSSGLTVSTDESAIQGLLPSSNDVLPVYIPKNRSVPIVYFSASTYRVDLAAGAYCNRYETTTGGTARPYKSDNVNTKITLSSVYSVRDRYFVYASDKTFQIICAGLDDNFGGMPNPSSGYPTYFRFPSGTPLDVTLAPNAQPSGANYSLVGSNDIYQMDNVTSFSEGPLSSRLP